MQNRPYLIVDFLSFQPSNDNPDSVPLPEPAINTFIVSCYVGEVACVVLHFLGPSCQHVLQQLTKK